MSSANNSSIVKCTLLKYKIQHTAQKKLTKYMTNSFFLKCNLRVKIVQEHNRMKKKRILSLKRKTTFLFKKEMCH